MQRYRIDVSNGLGVIISGFMFRLGSSGSEVHSSFMDDATAYIDVTSRDIICPCESRSILILLKNQADIREAMAGGTLYEQNLTTSGFGGIATDSAVPDIIVQPDLSVVIYTTLNKGLYSARVTHT